MLLIVGQDRGHQNGVVQIFIPTQNKPKGRLTKSFTLQITDR